MSTIKADAVTALSTNGDLSLDGLGTGGVSIASTLKMAKGGDIASASPLVIDTDGNYFDVTGTTNFSAMTVESGNFFMLQFDGALTITHGSGIELPGAANLTTATGDRLMCYATAANTVEVMSVETEAAAGGGGVVLQVIEMSLAKTSTTSVIPHDDTVPLITEGVQAGTQAITMASSSNKVHLCGIFSVSADPQGIYHGSIVALFRGTTCIATCLQTATANGAQGAIGVGFSVLDAPATSGSVTYSIRVGIGTSTNDGVMGFGYAKGGASDDMGATTTKNVLLLSEISI